MPQRLAVVALLAGAVALGGLLVAAPASAVASPLATGKVLVVRESGGDRDVYLHETGTGDEALLVADEGDEHSAVWSPDGAQVAFVRDGDIYVVDAMGATEPVQITEDLAADSNPEWSGDGTAVAFESNRSGGRRQIFRVYLDDPLSVWQLTTSTTIEHYDPTLSPDGLYVTVVRKTVGISDAQVVRVRISDRTTVALTATPGDYANPEYSPDGASIAFSSNRVTGTDHDVWVMAADGSAETAVTSSTTDEHTPRWVLHDGYPSARLSYVHATTPTTGDIRIVDASGANGAGLVTTADNDVAGDVQPLPGCSVVWDGGAGTTAWHTAANWDLDAVPGAAADVCIPDMLTDVTVTHPAGTPSVDTITTGEGLAIAGGTITATAVEATAGGAVTVAGGTVNAATLEAVEAGATLTVASGVANVPSVAAVSGAAIEISGGTMNTSSISAPWDVTVVLSGGTLGGAVNLASGTYSWSENGTAFGGAPWTVGSTARLYLATHDGSYAVPAAAGLVLNGTLDLATAGTIGGTGRISVAATGEVTKNDLGHTTTIAAPLDNDGTALVTAGTLAVAGTDGADAAADNDAGIFETGDDGTVAFTAGRTNLGSATALTGSGTFRLDGARLDLAAHGLTAPTPMALESGTLSGSGTLAGPGYTWASDVALSSPGQFTLDTTLELTTEGGSYALPAGGGLVNNATISLGRAAGIAGGGVLHNTPQGTLHKQATATALTDVDALVDNEGTVLVDAGALRLPAALHSGGEAAYESNAFAGGTYAVADGAQLAFDAPVDIHANAATFELTGTATVVDSGGLSVFRNLGSNSGTLTLHDGAAITSAGTLVNSGDITIGSDSTLTATTYTQTTGSTQLLDASSATLVAATATFAGGLLEGDGTIDGDVTSTGGSVAPGSPTGTLQITGDFTQVAGATLAVDIAGTAVGAFDVLDVAGTAALGGDLDVTTSGLAPASGDTFDIVTAVATPTVAFDDMTGLALPSGLVYRTETTATSLRLVASDQVAPSNPTLTATSHQAGMWSRDRTIDVALAGASDEHGAVAGYAVQWSTSPATTPGATQTHAAATASVTSPSLPDGSGHYVHVRTRDEAGNWSGAVHAGPFWVDGTAPTGARLRGPAAVSLVTAGRAPHVRVTWTAAADARSGVAGLRLVHRSTTDGSRWTRRAVNLGPTARAVSIRATAGATYCMRLTRTDAAGNAATGPQRCTSVPLDSSGLTAARRSPWRTTSAPRYYRASAVRTASEGASLTRRVTAQRIALVATTCRRCGSVQVLFKGKKVGRPVSLRSTQTRDRQVVPVGRFTSIRSGTVTLRVVTRGKPVIIDGLVARLR